MNLSPAEIALQTVIQETQLTVQTKEIPRLLRLIARNLAPESQQIPTAVFVQLLCSLRRKDWAKAIVQQIEKLHKPWITNEDAAQAVSYIHQPEPDEKTLLNVLQSTVDERLRQAGHTPYEAFENFCSEFTEKNHRHLTFKQLELLARDVAHAFEIDDVESIVHELCESEAERRQQQEEMKQLARNRRRDEIRKQKEWEASLISFKEIPPLLKCSHREVLRWIAENKLPVARKFKRDGREIWQFDPQELLSLRNQISSWRNTTSSPKKKTINLGDTTVKNKVLANVAAMDRYASHFATARALKRRITVVTGPTNSGKSYTALKTMAEAESGIALAPLRLLAHEFKEALSERGINASLKTGEERIIVPDSKFLAATVEMCPMHNPVDVAMIDEAQMLMDPDRGAAWTAAIMGVPARHLFVLGAPECIPLVRRIAKLCDDPYDEISLQRKTPLHTASSPIRLSQLQSGDALIAFSRREVLDLRETLIKKGHRVAVVYGALSPEVRRAEAKRFNTGKADILIATDAIGMGLNLSIKRVIFSTLYKFDGKDRRALKIQEVKQIGGRAGRYGKHETGIVGVLAGAGNPSFIQNCLDAPPEEINDLRPLVQPDSDIVQAIADEIKSDSLFGVLTRLRRAVLRRDDPNYRLADMEETFAIASSLEGVQGLSLKDRWTYSLCPVDDRDNGIQRLTRWAADHAAGKIIPSPGTGKLPRPDRASRQELERAEKRHKRLVAWRWLALRFPDVYPDIAGAEKTTWQLNEWIESVLRQQRQKVGL